MPSPGPAAGAEPLAAVRARIAGLQTGWPRRLHDAQGEWRTAVGKQPVPAARITPAGLEGDAVADAVNHGGPDKAILAYAANCYPAWERECGRPFPFGAFGENLTVAAPDPASGRGAGADETSVCIGDIWGLGEARLQITQAREPCYKPGRYWDLPHLLERMIATRRTGWYFRILAPGRAVLGAEMALLHRPAPQWPVARAYAVFLARHTAPAPAAALAACPGLSARWRDRLGATL